MKAFVINNIKLMIIALVLLITGCKQKKFDRAQWKTQGNDDIDFPYRNEMIEDLVNHHKIKGLTYKQLVDSLGEPQVCQNDSDDVYYDIETKYSSLDPISGKNLNIKLNKDSLVTGFEVKKWKRGSN
jgi:hypothetical protein